MLPGSGEARKSRRASDGQVIREVAMKIGVLGSGVVGQTLAAGFLKHGHEAMVGTQHPAKLKEWAAKTKSAKVGSFAEAAAFGEALVLAVKGSAAAAVLREAGAA